eukprot:COSAG01_NODE_5640_length_4123_cov_2.033052_2_plen_73_part_00
MIISQPTCKVLPVQLYSCTRTVLYDSTGSTSVRTAVQAIDRHGHGQQQNFLRAVAQPQPHTLHVGQYTRIQS